MKSPVNGLAKWIIAVVAVLSLGGTLGGWVVREVQWRGFLQSEVSPAQVEDWKEWRRKTDQQIKLLVVLACESAHREGIHSPECGEYIRSH